MAPYASCWLPTQCQSVWLGSESPAPNSASRRQVTDLTSPSWEIWAACLLLRWLSLKLAEKQPLRTKGKWRHTEVKVRGWERKEGGLPVDEQEVRHEAQHRGNGGSNGQVALKVVLQVQK